MIETPEGKFYTVPEVAKILGCSFQYVRKLVNGRTRKYQSYKLFEKPVVDQSLVRQCLCLVANGLPVRLQHLEIWEVIIGQVGRGGHLGPPIHDHVDRGHQG